MKKTFIFNVCGMCAIVFGCIFFFSTKQSYAQAVNDDTIVIDAPPPVRCPVCMSNKMCRPDNMGATCYSNGLYVEIYSDMCP